MLASPRRIGFRDHETRKPCVFPTTNFDLSARTVADVCNSRWRVDLILKWIKQRLKVKTLVGNSRNAVLMRLWTALYVHLILPHLKFANRSAWSPHEISRLF